jgi:extracellular elastinolytic metalloproteinase
MIRIIFTFLFAFSSLMTLLAQDVFQQEALRYIESQTEEWQLKPADVLDMRISDAYISKKKAARHVYVVQQYGGIDIHNAISSVHLNKEGEVIHANQRFVSNLVERVETFAPEISPSKAVQAVASHLGYSNFAPKTLKSDRSQNTYLFDKGEVSRVDIPARLKYLLTKDGKLRLVWDVELDELSAEDYWSIRVDAVTGQVLDVHSFTVKCQLTEGMYHRHESSCISEAKGDGYGANAKVAGLDFHSLMPPAQAATYHVFPFPAESPFHGERKYVSDQFNPEASPFGWHDTNGQPGAEFTVTRGNNVNAWPARDNENSAANQPNGGPELNFDFPFDLSDEPDASIPFATVQLFYFNNMVHDILYAYGFDEVSGNFQQNNYGKGGAGNDHVIARAQAGANAGSVNNANFSTPADGGNGRMNMFVWNRNDSGLLRVTEPSDIARKYDTGFADFGTQIGSTPISGKVVIGRDNTGQPLLGCETYTNASQIAGNIAMVDRGGCFFMQKTVRAEAAGARGIIICNFENSVLNMAAGGNFPNPGIPAVMLSSNDCLAIKRAIERGEEVMVTFVNEDTSGPRQVDGTVDNGIIAHEFGHGISNRLTGGPGQAGCLGNDEQMGEGWSDFITLVSSVREGDNGVKPRGIGTFVLSQPNSGRGIRRYPYSTDMGINPLTYDDIIGTTAPHPLGEVWVAMLWDLYWAMVDKHGFDPDILNGTGGNNMAVQLVMDGMRLQACSPGFVDGRNAIFAADRLNFNGENECLIWEVFARRGLGFNASQGSSNNRNDGTEGYEILPACYDQLRVVKRMTESIEAGQEIEVTIRLENYKNSDSKGIVVTDKIPEGTTFKAGSSSIPVAVVMNDAIVFEVGDMAPIEVKEFTYRLQSSENKGSKRIFFDDFEDFDTEADYELVSFKGLDSWVFTEDLPFQGKNSIGIYDGGESDQAFYNFSPVRFNATQPILRFWHDYATQKGFDAGTIDISADGGATWVNADPYIFKNPFIGKVDYGTFTLPNIRGYSGNSDGYIQSFVDLSPFNGTDFHFRFRFGANATVSVRQLNWSIDNLEIMDAFFYNSEVCVSYDGGPEVCAEGENRGTLVESGSFGTSAREENTAVQMAVFPNPTSNVLNIQLRNLSPGDVNVELISLEGKVLSAIRDNAVSAAQNLMMDISNFQNGVYLLRVKTPDGMRVEKVVLRK